MFNNIEFIGPSGAGKTTLFQEVLSNRKEKDWFTPDEALYNIAINKKDLTLRQKVRSIQLFLGLYRNSNMNIHSILSNEINVAINKTMPLYNDLIDLYTKDRILVENSEPYRNLISFDWYYHKLLNELVLIKHMEFKELVVYHDGFIHTAPFSENDSYKRIVNLLNPTAIVYCNISLEENLKRRKKRIASNKGNFIEVGLNDYQLKDLSEKSIQSAKYKVNLLGNLGVPIYEVNMENILKSDINEINNFINRYK